MKSFLNKSFLKGCLLGDFGQGRHLPVAFGQGISAKGICLEGD